jgi:hypothetical protein
MINKGEMLTEILKKFRDCYFFLHNTKESAIAEKILDEGFIFERQLEHSTDRINPSEPVEITYFMIQRREYGNYTIIIAIPKIIYDQYSSISNRKNVGIEEIISTTTPQLGDNDELVYTISPLHVLGYYNDITGEFFQNSKWDPFFNNFLEKHPDDLIKKPGKT